MSIELSFRDKKSNARVRSRNSSVRGFKPVVRYALHCHDDEVFALYAALESEIRRAKKQAGLPVFGEEK